MMRLIKQKTFTVLSILALLGCMGYSFVETPNVAPQQLGPANTLFGIAQISGSNALVSIDASTAQTTTIASFVGQLGVTIGDSALDFPGHRYFALVRDQVAGRNRLLSVDTQTGFVIAAPFVSTTFNGLQFDSTTNTLLATIALSGTETLVSIDSMTAQMTIIASFAGLLGETIGDSAVDSEGHRYFLVVRDQVAGRNRLLSVNTQTGAVIADPFIVSIFNGLEFDPSTGSLLGSATISSTNTLVTIDPTTAQVITIGSYPNLFGVTVGDSALDSANHIYYSVMRDQVVGRNRLVSIDTQSGAIVAEPFVSTAFNGLEVGLTVTTTPPSVNAGGPYTLNEGGSLVVSASGIDPLGGAVTYAWDLDNNGTYETPGQSVTFDASTIDGPSLGTIGVLVTDQLGLTATSTTTVTVLNVAPIGNLYNTGPVNEGSPVTIGISNGADPSPADMAAGLHYAFACDGGSLANTGYAAATPNTSTTCVFDDGPSMQTVRARIIDKDDGYTEYTATVAVANVAPVANFTASLTVSEGSPIQLALLNPFDPSNADATAGFTESFDCGDGSGYGPFGLVSNAACPTNDNGVRIVGGRIRDKDGGVTEYTATVPILNVLPTAVFQNNSGTIIQGMSATLAFKGQFDPSSVDTAAGFKYSFDCTNDGAFETTDQSASSYPCPYPLNGVFTARGRIKDKDGGYTDYTTAVTVLTPQQATGLVKDQVKALVTAGGLRRWQGDALLILLDGAIDRMDHGKATMANAFLRLFVREVTRFIATGILTPGNGQPLIDAVNKIITAINR